MEAENGTKYQAMVRKKKLLIILSAKNLLSEWERANTVDQQ